MFDKTRFERIYRYLIEHDEEIAHLKARVDKLETDTDTIGKVTATLERRANSHDEFSNYIRGCNNDNYDNINDLRNRVSELEGRRCHCQEEKE